MTVCLDQLSQHLLLASHSDYHCSRKRSPLPTPSQATSYLHPQGSTIPHVPCPTKRPQSQTKAGQAAPSSSMVQLDQPLPSCLLFPPLLLPYPHTIPPSQVTPGPPTPPKQAKPHALLGAAWPASPTRPALICSLASLSPLALLSSAAWTASPC
ncbi:unnamed protein product [Closterium sp. NIES-65]|nr:unnamed protein product [Closterium sp. NIES-65]